MLPQSAPCAGHRALSVSITTVGLLLVQLKATYNRCATHSSLLAYTVTLTHSSLTVLGPIYNRYMQLLTFSSEHSTLFWVETELFNASLYEEIFFESTPQVILQLVNYQYLYTVLTLTYLLTHSLTHSLTHLLTYLLTYLLLRAVVQYGKLIHLYLYLQ